MSAHTTKYVTRENAISLIMAFMATGSDQDLEELLFIISDPKLLRYQVRPDAEDGTTLVKR